MCVSQICPPGGVDATRLNDTVQLQNQENGSNKQARWEKKTLNAKLNAFVDTTGFGTHVQ